MPMYWTFNCFFRLHIYSILYSIYSIFSSKLTFKSWISTSEKKRTKLPELGSWGGGLGNSGSARKKTFFFLIEAFPYLFCMEKCALSMFFLFPAGYTCFVFTWWWDSCVSCHIICGPMYPSPSTTADMYTCTYTTSAQHNPYFQLDQNE